MMSTLVDLFREAANGKHRDNIVVCDSERELSLKELDSLSEQIAKYFVQKFHAKKGNGIAIYMDKCANYVLAYVAALKAGCAYIPIDVSYPESLLRDILKEVSPAVVCTTEKYLKNLPEGIPIYTFTPINSSYENIQLPKVEPHDRAYIVYSSGTTGKPKGIICPHRGAVVSYQFRFSTYPYGDDEREACNVFFVWEMFRPILKGIPMYIIPDSVIYDPQSLCEYLSEKLITRMLFTPSLLETILDTQSDHFVKKSFRSFRTIILCGEVVTMKLLDRIKKLLRNVQILNLYSVSECHDVSYADLTNYTVALEERKYVPVGTLIPGVKVAVFNGNLEMVPNGINGEIFVAGPTLAIGYVNRPELDRIRFMTVPEQFRPELGERMYRTGDWGYLLPNSGLEICGRCDSLVKIRGYSVEIKAIESNLNELSYIASCAVISIGAEGDDKKLAAYVVLKETVSRKKIRADLKQRLPFYMIPSFFVFLDKIPVLPSSSKVDKKGLPPINPEADVIEADSLPQTPTEIRLAKLWAEILSRSDIDIQESFFDLGGHSLMASRLLGKIQREFGVEFAMNDLFAMPTVSAMARCIDDSELKHRGQKRNLAKAVEIHDFKYQIMDLHLRAFWRSVGWTNRYYNGLILLTGVTGFIGSHILIDLLKNSQVRIICLIRQNNAENVELRLENSIERIGMLTDTLRGKIRERVKIFAGDVVLLRLGLSEEDYTFLSHDVDTVIHAAAYVNLIYPYEALQGVNVLGTRNLLDFCHRNKIKILHYLSTDAVIPEDLDYADEDIDSNSCDIDDRLCGGYAETKWVAEKLVQRAESRGLPTIIYRLGNQAASMLTGKWNSLDFIYLMLISTIRLKVSPKIDWMMEMTPVDFSSSFIARMATERFKSGIGKIFHLINSNALSWNQVIEWMRKFGIAIEIVSFNNWIQLVSDDPAPESQQLKKLIDGMIRDETYFAASTIYRRTNTDRELKEINCTYPIINETLFRYWLEILVDKKLIKTPGLSLDMEGKVCIITGASEGIGAAIATELALKGQLRVVLVARQTQKLEELAKKLKSKGCHASNILITKCDITSISDVENMVDCTLKTFGNIDVLVNCAGCMYYQLMKNGGKEEWDRQIDVNCRGTTYCIGTVLPHMMNSRSGHIVNITSDSGKKGFAGLAVYSGSKFYIEGMTQALRQEVLEYGIRITNIQPGDVATRLASRSIDQEARTKYDFSMAGHRILDTKDIASTVLFVISQQPHVAINEILIEPQAAPI